MKLDFLNPLLWAGLFILTTCVVNGAVTTRTDNTSSTIAPSEHNFLTRRKRMSHAEAAQIAEKGFEVTAVLVDTIKATYDSEDVVQTVLVVGKALLDVGAMFHPAFAGIGAVFSIFTLFLPAPDSPELAAIKAGFREMHMRFDKLESQIQALDSKLDLYTAISSYKTIRLHLQNVNRDYKNFGEMPDTDLYRKAFTAACANQVIEPLQALEHLHTLVVKPTSQDVPHLIPTIINHFKLEYKVILPWFKTIIADAVTLASLRCACFGAMSEEKDKAGILHAAKQSALFVYEIMKKLAEYELKVINLDPEYHTSLKNGMNAALQNAQNVDFATVYPTENGICTSSSGGEHHNPTYRWECRGAKNLVKTRYAIETHLKDKYEWLNWFVVVHKNAKDDPESTCSVSQPNRFITLSIGDDKVFVTWSLKDPIIARNIAIARPLLREALREPTRTRYLTQVGDLLKNEAYSPSKFMNTFLSVIESNSGRNFYDNKIFCQLGGMFYERAISREHIYFSRTDMAVFVLIEESSSHADFFLTYYSDNTGENRLGCQSTNEEMKGWGLNRSDHCSMKNRVSVVTKAARKEKYEGQDSPDEVAIEDLLKKSGETVAGYYLRKLTDDMSAKFTVIWEMYCERYPNECFISRQDGSDSTSYTSVEGITAVWSVGDYALFDLQYQIYAKEGQQFLNELMNLPSNPILKSFKDSGNVTDVYNFFSDPKKYYRDNKVLLSPPQITKLDEHFAYENRVIYVRKIRKSDPLDAVKIENCNDFKNQTIATGENQVFQYEIIKPGRKGRVGSTPDIHVCVFIVYYKPKDLQDSFPCKFTKARMKEMALESGYENTSKIDEFKRNGYACAFDPDFDPYDPKPNPQTN